MALFRPSGPLCFPVRQGAFSASGAGRAAVREFLGSILALFRPSGPLGFPVRQGAFSASGGRAAAATGTAGGFYVSYVSLYNQWLKKNGRKLLFF